MTIYEADAVYDCSIPGKYLWLFTRVNRETYDIIGVSEIFTTGSRSQWTGYKQKSTLVELIFEFRVAFTSHLTCLNSFVYVVKNL